MESIIAIYGPANVGKTHTLCKLIELIAHEQNIAVEISGDTKQTFVINGKTVCICTAGDNKWEVQKALEYSGKNNCDVAVLASRTKGGSSSTISSFAKENNVSLKWWRCFDTQSWPDDLRDEIQLTSAKLFRRFIDEMIG
jgi:GTPase SAR1 family protein